VLLAAGLSAGARRRAPLTAADRVYVASGPLCFCRAFALYSGFWFRTRPCCCCCPDGSTWAGSISAGWKRWSAPDYRHRDGRIAVELPLSRPLLLFMAMWAAGYWLIGLAIVRACVNAGALGLFAEAAFGVLWLGRRFDRFDASLELT